MYMWLAEKIVETPTETRRVEKKLFATREGANAYKKANEDLLSTWHEVTRVELTEMLVHE